MVGRTIRLFCYLTTEKLKQFHYDISEGTHVNWNYTQKSTIFKFNQLLLIKILNFIHPKFTDLLSKQIFMPQYEN